MNDLSAPYDEQIAEAEGWFISHCSGCSDGSTWQLQRRDEDPVFDSDSAAHAHVVAKAREGSKHHMAVLSFLRRHEPKEYALVIGSIPTAENPS